MRMVHVTLTLFVIILSLQVSSLDAFQIVLPEKPPAGAARAATWSHFEQGTLKTIMTTTTALASSSVVEPTLISFPASDRPLWVATNKSNKRRWWSRFQTNFLSLFGITKNRHDLTSTADSSAYKPTPTSEKMLGTLQTRNSPSTVQSCRTRKTRRRMSPMDRLEAEVEALSEQVRNVEDAVFSMTTAAQATLAPPEREAKVAKRAAQTIRAKSIPLTVDGVPFFTQSTSNGLAAKEIPYFASLKIAQETY